MEYLADTVAVIRHFSQTGKIGVKAKQILKAVDQGKHTIYISIISMVEVMYLAEVNRINIDFNKVKKKIIEANNYHIIDLNMDIVETAKKLDGFELHDRLIVATAKHLDIPILTSDKFIIESGAISVLWK